MKNKIINTTLIIHYKTNDDNSIELEKESIDDTIFKVTIIGDNSDLDTKCINFDSIDHVRDTLNDFEHKFKKIVNYEKE